MALGLNHTGAITIRHDVYVHMAEEETESIEHTLDQMTKILSNIVGILMQIQDAIASARADDEQLAGLEKSLDEGADDLASVPTT
jgi:hypothetical protein